MQMCLLSTWLFGTIEKKTIIWLTVDFLINIFVNIVRKQEKKPVQKKTNKKKKKERKQNPLRAMAKDLLTKLPFDQVAVVENNFRMNYGIGYSMLDIDDDEDDNRWIACRHYMLMYQMRKKD